MFLHVAHQLIERLKLLHQHVADIGTVKAADLNEGIVKPEQTHNIQPGGVIGGGRERHKRQCRETLTQLTQRGIFRAEIMPPLGNTVRFIYRQQYRVPVRQIIKEVIQHQALGRNVQQADLPATAACHHLLLLFTALGGVQTRRRYTVCQQLIDLVFHQGNQRRNNHGEAVEQ